MPRDPVLIDPAAEGFAPAEPDAARGAGSRTEPGAGYYLRPATPPRFVAEVALASLQRLLDLRPATERIAFAHHGFFAGAASTLVAAARDQLLVWVEAVREEAEEHLNRIMACGTDAASAPLTGAPSVV